MVVICAGTTGYKLTVDARYLWMRQKRMQGSHFANLKQAAAANRFVLNRQVDPCMSEVFAWADIPRAHMKMWKNQHKPGNMAVLVQAKRPGHAHARGGDGRLMATQLAAARARRDRSPRRHRGRRRGGRPVPGRGP